MKKKFLFFFDDKSLKILGYLIFESQRFSVDYDEDHGDYVVDVRGGFNPQIQGTITPTLENGYLRMSASGIKGDYLDADLVMLMIEPFGEGDDPERIMREGVREYARKGGLRETIEKRAEKEVIEGVDKDAVEGGFFKKLLGFFKKWL